MTKTAKCLISIVLAMAIVVSGLISTVAQDIDTASTEETTFWDGETYTKPQGSGTEADPYLVSAPAELAWMVNSFGGGSYFRLTNDIYINDVTKENWTETAKPWFPLGSTWFAYKDKDGAKKTFSGHIDGAGHTIYGVYGDGSDAAVNSALIPIMKKGSVKNLCVDSAYLNSRFSGGIIGAINGAVTVSDCVVKNSTITNAANAALTSQNGDRASGGIVGYVSAGASGTITASITNCATYNNTYDSSSKHKGGIAANMYLATLTIKNCYTDFDTVYGGSNGISTRLDTCILNVIDCCTVSAEVLKSNTDFQNWKGVKNFTLAEGKPVSKEFAGRSSDVWGGLYQTPTANEDGIFLITCPEEFAYMIYNYGKGSTYKLTTDIYLNDVSNLEWQNAEGLNGWFDGYWNKGYWDSSVATSGKYFKGTIDGNGYVVYGLYDDSTDGSGGLIPVCDGNTVIKNLGLSNAVVNGRGASGVNGYAGGFIGTLKSTNVTFENCFVENTLIDAKIGFKGSFIGNVNTNAGEASITISNCFGTTGHNLIGIVTAITTATMSNSYSIGATPYNTAKLNGTTTNTNVYTDTSCTIDGVTVLTTNQMKGYAALTNMSGLGSDKWYSIGSGAPMLRVRGAAIGDANENGKGGEYSDITALRLMIITNTLNANSDYNRDGNENICDLVKMTVVMETTNMEGIIATYGDYFGFEMKIITEEIDALSEENVNYIFITDLHFGNGTSAQDKLILKQMESITKLANADDSIDFVVVGGDVTTGMYDTKEKAIAATNAALAPLKSCTKPVLVLTGNHDDNSYHVYSGDKVYIPERILSDMDWTTQVLSVNCPETIVHDKNYENSKYYYYDLPTKKTRVICLNAIDYRAPFDENGNIIEMEPADFPNNTYFGKENVPARQYKSGCSYLDYSAEQLRWLTEQALIVEDYNYIFVSHMGIDLDTNAGGKTTYAGYGDKLRDIMEAYHNKTVYADDDITADFTSYSGKILSYQFGHIHVELTHYSEDIDLWQICSSTANVNQKGAQSWQSLNNGKINNKTLDWNPVYRSVGDETEACFDVMSVGKDAVYKFNIGAGATKKLPY